MVADSTKIKPVVLVIMDGWGVAPPGRGNAVSLAQTPNVDYLLQTYPAMTLQASGEAVGLPWGEMGNSEVGHLNLGAGQIVWQSLPRIDRAITSGDFYNNPAFLKAMAQVKANNSALHLLGLFSDGAVHSSHKHLYALLEMAIQQQVDRIYLHLILDGRDTAKDAGKFFIQELMEKIKQLGKGEIATLSGRFYAMDRDNHWERTALAYQAMTKGLTRRALPVRATTEGLTRRATTEGKSEQTYVDPLQAVEDSYQQSVYDEEFKPVVLTKNNQPVATVKPGDSVIFFNYRPDRTRQLTKAFVLDNFDGFKREKIKDLCFVTMTEYEEGLPVEVAFPPQPITRPLAKVISDLGLKQFHTAETEKYAHVTFFFNGGKEQPYPGEDRKVVPSPRIPSYADQPVMSAPQVEQGVVQAINSGRYHFIVVNFANGDMVGHTGNIPAAVQAVQTVDQMVGQIVQTALSKQWAVVIIADHGNCEEMLDSSTGEKVKEHSTNPVPLIVVDANRALPSPLTEPPDLTRMTPVGVLADVAPTILKLMGIAKPKEMTGAALV